MENQDIFGEVLIHKIESEVETHLEKKVRQQKKIIKSAVKHLRKLATDKIYNRVGEC